MKKIECSDVYNNKELIGVLMLRDLIIANPNTIVEEVMTYRYTCIDYIWHKISHHIGNKI